MSGRSYEFEGNTVAEMEQKLREYFDSGTRLVWIIDPVARSVAVYDGPASPRTVSMSRRGKRARAESNGS